MNFVLMFVGLAVLFDLLLVCLVLFCLCCLGFVCLFV